MKPLLTRTVAPAARPYVLSDVKRRLRVDFTDDDALLQALLDAATEAAEDMLGRALITQTWQIRVPRVSGNDRVWLPRPPVQALASVSYFDGDNVEQTIATDALTLVADDDCAFVYPDHGTTWPAMYDRADALSITFTAGYGDTASSVPEGIRHAIALLADHWFHRRETADAREVPPSVESLLGLHRVGFVHA